MLGIIYFFATSENWRVGEDHWTLQKRGVWICIAKFFWISKLPVTWDPGWFLKKCCFSLLTMVNHSVSQPFGRRCVYLYPRIEEANPRNPCLVFLPGFFSSSLNQGLRGFVRIAFLRGYSGSPCGKLVGEKSSLQVEVIQLANNRYDHDPMFATKCTSP